MRCIRLGCAAVGPGRQNGRERREGPLHRLGREGKNRDIKPRGNMSSGMFTFRASKHMATAFAAGFAGTYAAMSATRPAQSQAQGNKKYMLAGSEGPEWASHVLAKRPWSVHSACIAANSPIEDRCATRAMPCITPARTTRLCLAFVALLLRTNTRGRMVCASRMVVEPCAEGIVAGVFDGHYGPRTAEFARQNTRIMFTDALR